MTVEAVRGNESNTYVCIGLTYPYQYLALATQETTSDMYTKVSETAKLTYWPVVEVLSISPEVAQFYPHETVFTLTGTNLMELNGYLTYCVVNNESFEITVIDQMTMQCKVRGPRSLFSLESIHLGQQIGFNMTREATLSVHVAESVANA